MKPIVIPVNTDRPYDVVLGRGVLSQAGRLIREVNQGRRAMIVCDNRVSALYAQALMKSLMKQSYRTVSVISFTAGEQHKQMDTVIHIYKSLAKGKFDRDDLIIGLGGGVVGDVAGFAAATWMRGIGYVQIPTTLLAQVDSSVGGKTGINLPEGKNLVGAFWQPLRVITDIDTLSTLPEEFVADGMGEVVKTACIGDAELFSLLEKDQPFSPALLTEIVRRCILVKTRIVERDEREAGERKYLNFGHTLGHALEQKMNYTNISHGCAVSVGMAAVIAATERHGLTAPGTAARVCALLNKFALPTIGPMPISEYIDGVKADKKCSGGQLDLVTLREIGTAVCERMPIEKLEEWLLH